MAKRIKAIKCPQCGSTKVKEQRTDYYRCSGCHTEFFIDSDDIHIHHSYETDIPNPVNIPNQKYIIAGVAAFMIVMFIVSSIFYTRKPSADGFPLPAIALKGEQSEKERFVWDDIDEMECFANAGGEGMIAVIGEGVYKKGYTITKEEKPYMGIYRVADQKQIQLKQMSELENIDLSKINIRTFENGDVYVIIDKRKLFKLNTATYELSEVIFQTLGLPEFEKGVFQIEFEYDNDGFKVINEMGKELYYFPIINKVYDKNEFYDAQSRKTADAKKRAAFVFTGESFDYPDEKPLLIKYYYWHQTGYPYDMPHFAWWKDYGGSGIFTDRDPYRKVLMSAYQAESSRVISWKNFTPDREYISGTVMAYDDKEVMIAFSTTLSGNKIVQLLDAETAEIKWTLPADKPYLIGNYIRVKEGYLFSENNKTWLFDTQKREGNYMEWDFRQIE